MGVLEKKSLQTKQNTNQKAILNQHEILAFLFSLAPSPFDPDLALI